jgi:hypothetical protein
MAAIFLNLNQTEIKNGVRRTRRAWLGQSCIRGEARPEWRPDVRFCGTVLQLSKRLEPRSPVPVLAPGNGKTKTGQPRRALIKPRPVRHGKGDFLVIIEDGDPDGLDSITQYLSLDPTCAGGIAESCPSEKPMSATEAGRLTEPAAAPFPDGNHRASECRWAMKRGRSDNKRASCYPQHAIPVTEEAAGPLPDGQHSVQLPWRLKGRRCRHFGHTVMVWAAEDAALR